MDFADCLYLILFHLIKIVLLVISFAVLFPISVVPNVLNLLTLMKITKLRQVAGALGMAALTCFLGIIMTVFWFVPPFWKVAAKLGQMWFTSSSEEEMKFNLDSVGSYESVRYMAIATWNAFRSLIVVGSPVPKDLALVAEDGTKVTMGNFMKPGRLTVINLGSCS